MTMATNALAVAALTVRLVLPAFSDFAEKAELDLPLPITESRVTKSFVSKTQPTVMVVVDGRHQFNWRSWVEDKTIGMAAQLYVGAINYYDNSNSITSLPDGSAPLISLSGKKSLITTNEAREIALSFLKRADYDLSKGRVRVDPPRVKPWRYTPNDPQQRPLPLPAFDVEFIRAGVKKPEWFDVLLDVEVSGLTKKKITRFTSSPELFEAVSVDLRKFAPH